MEIQLLHAPSVYQQASTKGSRQVSLVLQRVLEWVDAPALHAVALAHAVVGALLAFAHAVVGVHLALSLAHTMVGIHLHRGECRALILVIIDLIRGARRFLDTPIIHIYSHGTSMY